MRYLLCVLVLMLAPVRATAENVVYIELDDATACYIGVYTAAHAECIEAYSTPEIDILANAGVRFDKAWAEPVCSPARATALTGTHPREHGVGTATDIQAASSKVALSAARPNLARTLEAAGVHTYTFGKWHLGREEQGAGLPIHPSQMGFTGGRGSLGNLDKTSIPGPTPAREGGVGYYDWQMCDFMTGVCAVETTYATQFTIDDAIEVLDNTEPWYMAINFNAPHSPFHVPPDDLIGGPDVLCDDIDTDDDHICYNRAILAIDTAIGLLVNHVNYDPTDTKIFITADNGTSYGVAVEAQPLWEAGRCKSSVGECGLWVPMIASGAGIGVGTTSTLIQRTDIHATILDIFGVQNPGAAWDSGSFLPMAPPSYDYSGKSFLPFLVDPSRTGGRSCIYAEQFRIDPDTGATLNRHQAIRDATHKLIRHDDAGADPAEECFLVADIREAVADRIALPDANCTALGAKLDVMHDVGDICSGN